MSGNVTGPQPAAEGRTVYVMPDPAGLGATLDQALAVEPDARNVVVCGDRLGGRGETRAWVDRLDPWQLTSVEPYVERHGIRLRAARDGHLVSVSRAEVWFGQGVEPEHARDAMRIVRGVVAEWGCRPIAHPSVTGRRMLLAHYDRHGYSWPDCGAEVAELLRSTSGQGRFEVMPAAAPEGGGVWPRIYYSDARFQYAACAATELPEGEPQLIDGEPPDPYASSWCRVRWQPAEGMPIGLLPYHLDGKRWTWPTEGAWSGWCSGAELHLARRHGYSITVERSLVWPARSRRPLHAFATMLARHRDRVDGLNVDHRTRAAARNALRAVLVSTVGSLHGYAGGRPVVETQRDGHDENPPADQGAGSSLSRPEWTTAVWALARVRLARAMLAQPVPVLGCTLDGFYTAGRPLLAADSGSLGTFRLIGSTQWPDPIRTLPELYEMGATIEPERAAA